MGPGFGGFDFKDLKDRVTVKMSDDNFIKKPEGNNDFEDKSSNNRRLVTFIKKVMNKLK